MQHNWFDLSGHVTVVTGGNAGIGLGIACGLVRAGAKVAIWGTNRDRNESALARLRHLRPDADVSAHRVDVADENAVEAAMEDLVVRYGRLDSCFANAGVAGRPAQIDATSTDDWRWTLSINLDGVFFTFRSAAKRLRQLGNGGALVVTSSLGALTGMPLRSSYAASKAAVTAMVRSLAVELARDGVTVNALLPGWTETALFDTEINSDAVRRVILSRIPLRRWGQPSDFEALAVVLAGPGSRYMTGQAMVVDGGYSIF